MGKRDDAVTTRYADMLAAMGTEPRLRIVRLLLSAHPEGMVVGEIGTELDITSTNQMNPGQAHLWLRRFPAAVKSLRNQWLCLQEPSLAPIRSLRLLAQGAWARYTVPAKPTSTET